MWAGDFEPVKWKTHQKVQETSYSTKNPKLDRQQGGAEAQLRERKTKPCQCEKESKNTISMKISVLALQAVLANKRNGYTKYTKCLDIDDKGNRVQYRYFCDQGSFFVQVSP